MIKKAKKSISARRPNKSAITTTVFDLLRELTALTKDDALVMAAIKNIFTTRNVRLTRSLAPVRLVVTDTLRRHPKKAGAPRPAWA